MSGEKVPEFLESLFRDNGPLINGYGPGLFAQPRPGGLWFYQRLEDPWVACQRIAVRDGRPIVAEMLIVPVTDRFARIDDEELPVEGLTARVSRLAKARAHLEAADAFTGVGLKLFGVYFPELGRRFTKASSDVGKPIDLDYAVLASKYLDKIVAGSAKPVKELAAVLNMPAPRLRDLIHESRRRGLLTSMPRGQAGGELTPKALELLTDHLEERNPE